MADNTAVKGLDLDSGSLSLTGGNVGVLEAKNASNLLIDENIITAKIDHIAGVFFEDATNTVVSNNNINVEGMGFGIYSRIQANDILQNNIVSGNNIKIVGNSAAGITFSSIKDKQILKNKVLNNTIIKENSLEDEFNRPGIQLISGTINENEIINNIITINQAPQGAEGIDFSGDEIVNNSVKNNVLTIKNNEGKYSGVAITYLGNTRSNVTLGNKIGAESGILYKTSVNNSSISNLNENNEIMLPDDAGVGISYAVETVQDNVDSGNKISNGLYGIEYGPVDHETSVSDNNLAKNNIITDTHYAIKYQSKLIHNNKAYNNIIKTGGEKFAGIIYSNSNNNARISNNFAEGNVIEGYTLGITYDIQNSQAIPLNNDGTAEISDNNALKNVIKLPSSGEVGIRYISDSGSKKIINNIAEGNTVEGGKEGAPIGVSYSAKTNVSDFGEISGNTALKNTITLPTGSGIKYSVEGVGQITNNLVEGNNIEIGVDAGIKYYNYGELDKIAFYSNIVKSNKITGINNSSGIVFKSSNISLPWGWEKKNQIVGNVINVDKGDGIYINNTRDCEIENNEMIIMSDNFIGLSLRSAGARVKQNSIKAVQGIGISILADTTIDTQESINNVVDARVKCYVSNVNGHITFTDGSICPEQS